MTRLLVPLVAFAAGWVPTILILLLVLQPEIADDYARAFVIASYFGVVSLVGLVAVYHQRAWRSGEARMQPWLVWGMGGSYLIAAGAVALEIYERAGEPLAYRTVALAASLLLALVWLVPLLSHLSRRRD